MPQPTTETIHAIVTPEIKKSVRDWCNRHDLNESQLLRRAIQAILSGKVSSQ